MATILVVDDERDLCELIRINLALDGHNVLVAHDGDSGLAAVEADRPDLVVLDVMMPGRDGFSVLETMKASSPDVATTPVVMLTARAEAIDRVKGGIEGAVRYLTKPFSVVALRKVVGEVLLGDEPTLRRRAQTEALSELARIEAGRAPGDAGVARPRLTRLEPQGAPAPAVEPAPPELAAYRTMLTERQRQLLDAVLDAPDLRTASERMGVSRSYLYASLRRIARKVGVASGPELVASLRTSAQARRDQRRSSRQ